MYIKKKIFLYLKTKIQWKYLNGRFGLSVQIIFMHTFINSKSCKLVILVLVLLLI